MEIYRLKCIYWKRIKAKVKLYLSIYCEKLKNIQQIKILESRKK